MKCDTGLHPKALSLLPQRHVPPWNPGPERMAATKRSNFSLSRIVRELASDSRLSLSKPRSNLRFFSPLSVFPPRWSSASEGFELESKKILARTTQVQ